MRIHTKIISGLFFLSGVTMGSVGINLLANGDQVIGGCALVLAGGVEIGMTLSHILCGANKYLYFKCKVAEEQKKYPEKQLQELVIKSPDTPFKNEKVEYDKEVFKNDIAGLQLISAQALASPNNQSQYEEIQ